MHPAWKPPVAEWVGLAPGVRFLMRSPSADERLTAASMTAQLMANLREGRGDLMALGFEGEIGLIEDENVLLGISALAGAAFLADAIVDDWEGFCDEAGEAIPLTQTAMRAALRWGPPEGGTPICETFLAWCDRARTPIGKDLERLRALALWEYGGGAKHCEGCKELNEACATGGLDSEGSTCPRDRHKPLSVPGIAAWFATRSPGTWQRAGINGTLAGLNYPSAMARGQAHGCYDAGALVRCLEAVEAGALEAEMERLKATSTH